MCFSLKIMHYSNYPAKTQGGTNTTVLPHPNPRGGARAPPALNLPPPLNIDITSYMQFRVWYLEWLIYLNLFCSYFLLLFENFFFLLEVIYPLVFAAETL